MAFSRLLCACVCLASSLAFAWGFEGHRQLAEMMHEPMPKGHCVSAFIAARQNASFQDMAADPDRWREQDPDEAPRHYLEIDFAQPIHSYPREYAEVERKLGAQNARRNGTVPWRVEEYSAKLVESFASKDPNRILATLAHFSHYVTDAFSPFHDTRYFNPRLSPDDSEGLHSRYETKMLSTAGRRNEVAKRTRGYFGTLGKAHPKDTIFEAVLTGNPLAQEITNADVESNGDVLKLYQRTMDLTARRWADALTVQASLILNAWKESGSPRVSGMPAGCDDQVSQDPMSLKGYPYVHPPVVEPKQDAGGSPVVPGQEIPPEQKSGCAAVPGVLPVLVLLGMVVSSRIRLGRGQSRRR